MAAAKAADKTAGKTVIKLADLPANSLLQRYRDRGDFTDCYRAELPRSTPFESYVEAFYCTRLFKLERWILAWAIKRPSSDQQAAQLANNQIQQFAAWDVEARSEQQLLLCDLHQRTRSWLMRQDSPNGSYLYFGSAVVRTDTQGEALPNSWLFSFLGGFHALYSRALLRAAKTKLLQQGQHS